MTHFDLVVLGTGSGNTIVDDRFSDRSVAIVESRTFGGTCLNRGCIPSKMFVHTADLAQAATEGPTFGVETTVDGVDWPSVRDRVFKRIDGHASGGEDYRRGQENVTVYGGEARFVGPRELTVELPDGATERISGDQVVLAVGGRPVVPEIDGLDDLRGPNRPGPGASDAPGDPEWVTSDDVMRLPRLPRRLAVIGGGYVGVELAHVFASLGTEVTQVESADRLLGNQDAELAATFTRWACRRWDVRVDTSLDRVRRSDDGVVLTLSSDRGEEEVAVDVVLLAVGRRPNTDRVDAAAAGLELDDKDRVVVDEHQRTSVEGVWALGDVTDGVPLKHAANADARTIQHNLLHPDDLAGTDHDHVPSAVFSSPQLAAVGLTEEQARQDDSLDLVVVRHELADVAYGWALEDDRFDDDDLKHLVKLLADKNTGRLVGAHVLAPMASVLIQPLIAMVTHGTAVKGYARSMYWIHPSPTEVVENALLKLEDEL